MIADNPSNPIDPAAIDEGLRLLRRFTPARIALGRAGPGQPTEANLRFMLDHARARDAVHAGIDFESIDRKLRANDWDVIRVHSAAPDRVTYLRRPDLGRRLSPVDRQALEDRRGKCDVMIVAADGLSAMAVNVGLLPLLDLLRPLLLARGYSVGPLVFIDQGRVAIGDEVGEVMGAKLIVVLIGERPGLSAADSLGAYVTWRPRVGTVDSGRNCISNIRSAGLSFREAAGQIADLVALAFVHNMTGVRLNEFRPAGPEVAPGRLCQRLSNSADWQFTTADARVKLERLYPQFLATRATSSLANRQQKLKQATPNPASRPPSPSAGRIACSLLVRGKA